MKKLLLLFLVLLMISISACFFPPPQRAERTNTPSPTANLQEEPPNGPQEDIQSELTYEITFTNAVTWTSSIGTGWIQVIVEVLNNGTLPLYLSSGTIDLEDESGAFLSSIRFVSAYPDIIEPGEKGYYIESTFFDEDIESIVVLPRPDVRRARIDNIRFDVSEFSLSESRYGGINMRGRVENTHYETHEMLYIVAILLDENDNPIAHIFTILMELFSPSDIIGFESSTSSIPPNITVDDVARYEVFAYPLQFQFN
jgi:hypothetical protein